MAVNESPDILDARDVVADRQRPLGRLDRPRRDGFQVIFTRDALDVVVRHGNSRRDVEVGGVLAGEACADAHGVYLLIDLAVVADTSDQSDSHFTFTGHTWSDIHDKLNAARPDARIVGWFHTHPGHGVFLSGMDLFIQRGFFDAPHMVALVFDPRSGEIGTFVWRDGQPTREPTLVELEPWNPSNEIATRATASTKPAAPVKPTPLPTSADVNKTSSDIGQGDAPQTNLTRRRRGKRRAVRVPAPAYVKPPGADHAGPVVRTLNQLGDEISHLSWRQRIALGSLVFIGVLLVMLMLWPAPDAPPKPDTEAWTNPN
jgi:proteasome lid subunit RPN8/RPN11